MENPDNSIKGWWSRLSPKKKIAIILTPIIIVLALWYSTTDAYKQDAERYKQEQAQRDAADSEERKECAAAFGRAIGGALMDKASEKSEGVIKEGANKLKDSVGGLFE